MTANQPESSRDTQTLCQSSAISMGSHCPEGGKRSQETLFYPFLCFYNAFLVTPAVTVSFQVPLDYFSFIFDASLLLCLFIMKQQTINNAQPGVPTGTDDRCLFQPQESRQLSCQALIFLHLLFYLNRWKLKSRSQELNTDIFTVVTVITVAVVTVIAGW